MDRLSDTADLDIDAKSHPSQKQDDLFKLGDVVTIYDDNNKPINGVVRWVGRNREILKDGSEIVGIETVSFSFVSGFYYEYVYIIYVHAWRTVRLLF